MDGRKIDRAVCAGPLWSTAGGFASFREARSDTRVSVPIVRDLSDQFCSRKCSGLIGGAKRCNESYVLATGPVGAGDVRLAGALAG